MKRVLRDLHTLLQSPEREFKHLLTASTIPAGCKLLLEPQAAGYNASSPASLHLGVSHLLSMIISCMIPPQL